jgi:DNA repair photolyase
MFKRFDANYEHSAVSVQDFTGLEVSCKKLEGSDLPVLLSFTGDPYCHLNDTEKATRKALEILLKYNIKVSILTKGGKRCLQDLDLFKAFGNRIRIGATLTLDNDADSLKWEPGAALPGERLETLKILHEAGIKTFASFEPVLSPRQSLNLMKAGLECIDLYKVGKLNNYKGLDKQIDWHDFLLKTVALLRKNMAKFYVKVDLKAFADFELYPDEIDPDYYNDFER